MKWVLYVAGAYLTVGVGFYLLMPLNSGQPALKEIGLWPRYL